MYEEIEKVTDGFWNEYIKSLEPMGWCVTLLKDDSTNLNPWGFEELIRKVKEEYIPKYNSDLIEVTGTPACACPECAKYRERIFSLFGMDDRFPRFPEWLIKTKNLHCGLSMYPFEYGFSRPTFSGDIFEMSNRPFVDDRPQEYIDTYYKLIAEYKEEQQDRATFAMLEEDYPDIAPKSYGAYRRMKKAKTKGYLKLAEELKKDNIELPL